MSERSSTASNSILFASFLDGFAYYEEWQDEMKKADEKAKVMLRHYGDSLKSRDDVCHLIVRSVVDCVIKLWFLLDDELTF